jgi:hypothetical protein
MANRLPFLIYLVGVFPLAYWQAPVRAALGDWLSFALVVAYLLDLRLLGFWAVRWQELRQKKIITGHNLSVDSKKQQKRERKT